MKLYWLRYCIHHKEKFFNHAYFVASKHAMNSASIVEDAVRVYLVLFYATTPLANMKILSQEDFLESRQPTKSASKYPIKSR